MRVLVYPHDLNIGGSQLNAIEIAGRVRDAGHEVVVFGREGTLNARIGELGLEFVASVPPGRRPSLRVARQLAGLVRTRGFDVLHGYEWPPALEVAAAAALSRRATAVATVMSMAVAPFLPHRQPLVVGTEQIAAHEKSLGRRRVDVIEPPVDLDHNSPALDLGVPAWRARWGIRPDRLTVVVVTRLAHEMKLEGVLAAIAAVTAPDWPVPTQLVIVGDGPAMGTVRERAAAANAATGADTVVLTGELTDPRAAYAAADVMLGMGGSALRSLAFGKPLVVVGEQGFFRLLSADTVDQFLWTGWYGVGSGPAAGPAALLEAIRPALVDADRRATLGAFGLDLVRRRFSLDAAATRQLQEYERALALGRPGPGTALDGARSLARLATHLGGRRLAKLRGRAAVDDFNSRPVAALAGPRPEASPGSR